MLKDIFYEVPDNFKDEEQIEELLSIIDDTLNKNGISPNKKKKPTLNNLINMYYANSTSTNWYRDFLEDMVPRGPNLLKRCKRIVHLQHH